MSDFRLTVFYTVAQRLSFTRAATELFISQPAVTRHIQALERAYSCKLFDRSGPKIRLTAQGEALLRYAEKIFSLYRELSTELALFGEAHRGLLQIGSSTTAAQYVLPGHLAAFKSRYPAITLKMTAANTETVENLLLEGSIDLGVVEGKTKRRALVYTPCWKDELVLCTRFGTPVRPVLFPSDLENLPFVTREKGSGTLEIMAAALAKAKLPLDRLRVEMVLENNESIKNYLRHSAAFAFLSLSAIGEELQTQKLKIVPLEGFTIDRFYYLVTQQGALSQPASLFARFLLADNPTL